MRLCKLDDIESDATLARAVITPDYQILLSEGTMLRPDYVEKLKDIGITEVYVEDKRIPDAEEVAILKKDIEDNVKTQIKTVLEKHTYNHNEELMALNHAADDVIMNILEEDQVIEQVFDIKERSSDLYEHSLSLCSLSVLTAIKLGLSQEEVHDIGVGSLLHDIGLRYLTINYEDKDLEEMSDVERGEYKKHSVYGYTALRQETWISERVKNIILYHHERMDGSGYPLRATDIPTECRVISVCDSFDEMICGMGCKRIKVHEAVDFLKNNKDTKFDEKVVNAFLDFTAVYPAGSLIKTNEGEVGIVLRQNKEFPDRPVIKIVRDKVGNQVIGDRVKDLKDVDNVYITEVLDR